MSVDLISRDSVQPQLSPTDIIDEICDHYGCDSMSNELEWASSDALRLQVTSWCKWFAYNHQSDQPRQIANAQSWSVDFKVFFLTYPVAGAHILRVTEACYGIDRAICGTSKFAQKEAERWRDMDQFDYLMRHDLISWWAAELSQLLEDIDQNKSNRLANSLRFRNFEVAASNLRDSLVDFGDAVFIYMDETFNLTESFALQDRIANRKKLVSTSLEALQLSMIQAEGKVSKSLTEYKASGEYKDQACINNGIYSRMPRFMAINDTPLPNGNESPGSVLSPEKGKVPLTTPRSWCWVYIPVNVFGLILSCGISHEYPLASIMLSFVMGLFEVVLGLLIFVFSERQSMLTRGAGATV